MELRRARFVSIYGMKGESNLPILTVRDCDHVRLFGYLLGMEHTITHCGAMGLFDAPEPWGPWTTVE